MADVTINALTVAPSIVSSLLLPVTDGASTYKLSVANVNSLAPVQSVAARTGAVVLTKSDVGLGLVEDKTSATIRSEITSANVTAALGFTPYSNANPSGFITGITSGNVTTALGFTPYSNANPSAYITGITSGNVTTALGFTPYSNANPSGYISNTNASVARAWVSFTGIGTNGQAVTTLQKYNVSTVVRNTINSWTINFTAGTFSNANYVVTGCGRFQNNVNNDSTPLFGVQRFTDPTTSSCRVACVWDQGSAEIQTVYAAFFGS